MNKPKHSDSIAFYNQNAESFFNNTVAVNLTDIYQQFLPLLPAQSNILDAGCASGRDSKYFIEQGFTVCAFDASKVLAEKASEYLGFTVCENTFEQYQNANKFDGIWSCASLLHIPSTQLNNAFANLASLLNSNGTLSALIFFQGVVNS